MLKFREHYNDNDMNDNIENERQIVSTKETDENSRINEYFRIYIGIKPYTVIYNSNEVNKLMQYINHVINYAWNYIESSRFTNLIDNVAAIAINMISSILKYNNFPGIDKCKVLVTENNILLSEPIVVTINSTKMTDRLDDADHSLQKQPCVMVSQKLIKECWKVSHMPQVQFDDITRFETFQDMVNCSYEYMKEIPMQEELLQLLVVADHAANHYMEEIAFNKTDYINHINFAKSFYTLHSKLHFRCKVNAKRLSLNLLGGIDL